jgi:secreted trypsin-like serine protease
VVGGKPTSKGEWRSLVYIEARIAPDRAASCGGTVIAERWVLTAGHCVVGKNAADFTITEGTDKLTAGGYAMRTDRVVLHEDYASGPPRNDIALLHLAVSAQSPGQALIGDLAGRNLLHAGAALEFWADDPPAGIRAADIEDFAKNLWSAPRFDRV